MRICCARVRARPDNCNLPRSAARMHACATRCDSAPTEGDDEQQCSTVFHGPRVLPRPGLLKWRQGRAAQIKLLPVAKARVQPSQSRRPVRDPDTHYPDRHFGIPRSWIICAGYSEYSSTLVARTRSRTRYSSTRTRTRYRYLFTRLHDS